MMEPDKCDNMCACACMCSSYNFVEHDLRVCDTSVAATAARIAQNIRNTKKDREKEVVTVYQP